jgi:hypothetical protein
MWRRDAGAAGEGVLGPKPGGSLTSVPSSAAETTPRPISLVSVDPQASQKSGQAILDLADA